MINKNGVWFVTLFSLILVLSIYYITMPTELLISKEKDKVLEYNGYRMKCNKRNIT